MSSNDQTYGYLEAKTTGVSSRIVLTTLNDGVDEKLQIDIGSDVFTKSTNTTDNITEGTTNLYFTNERAQDAIGSAFLDTASIDLTYNDAANTISAAVLPAGVDHNSLQNFVANKHIDHSGVSISPGTGLSGGGDITASRTLNIANTTVTASTYGSSSNVPTYTVNAQGQLTAAANVAVDKLYDHWHGTTQYTASQLRMYTNTGTTDANGRMTFALTTTGIAGGTALFTAIRSIQAIGVDASGNAIQVPEASIETVSATSVTLRFARGTTTNVLIGGTVVSAQYCGAGYTAYVTIIGVK